MGVTMNGNNDQVLVDLLVTGQQTARATRLPDDSAFEFFVCDNVLKDLNLSAEEIDSGLIGGADDGAIDGVYTFLDDLLLDDDSDIFGDSVSPHDYRRGALIRLRLIQAKRTPSFSETAIDLVGSSTRRLLDLQYDHSKLELLYSRPLLQKVELFTEVVKRLVTRHPTVKIEFTYATRGNIDDIHPKVRRKATELERQFHTTLGGATGTVQFFGAKELRKLAAKAPSDTLTLKYQENITSGCSHVALVTLRDYLGFITNNTEDLLTHIFDSNVRDYQGQVEVNREISHTLDDSRAPDFWWLNNGVTVVCSKASLQSKTYTLDDVQIVNGLQTSYIIFRDLLGRDRTDTVFDRILLVRILETRDSQTRDRVIRATNRQTSVPMAQLRATDDIQRSIELYFEPNGWFYDRRKNYYRNLGKPVARIVGISVLAQAVMALGLSRPNDARARPSSLLKADDNYDRIFSKRIPLGVYLWVAKIQKRVDAFLQDRSSRQERTDLRFHVSMLAVARLVGHAVTKPEELEVLANDDVELTDEQLWEALVVIRSIVERLIDVTGVPRDKISKGRDLVDAILAKEAL